MSSECYRCGGSGIDPFEEDNRLFNDTCYHCGGEGVVDEQTAHHDRLMSVAYVIADIEISESRRARNNDPDGEGWDFCAAEHGLSGWDLFKIRVEERAEEIAQKLWEMSSEEQSFFLTWLQVLDNSVR